MPPYVSPGDAFSSGYQDFLQQQQQNELARAQEARLAQHAANEDALAKEALNEKRIANQAKLDEKEKAETQAEIAGMQPGDIPSGETVARARRHHIPMKIQATEMQPPPVPAALAAEGETNVEPTSLAPQMNPNEVAAAQPANPPQAIASPERGGGMGTGVYAGSPGYLEAQRNQKALMDQADASENPAMKSFYQMYASTITPENPKGNVPSGSALKAMTAGEGSDATTPVVRIGRNGQLETLGNVPKGAHFQSEPAPIRISMPRNTEGATEKDIQASREKVYTEAAKQSQGDVDHLKKMRVAEAMMNQGDRSADALLAPLIIGSTISGMGSGFRMTQAEINKVEGATSVWGALRQKLQTYDTDPNSRAFTPDQLTFMKKLLVAAKDKAEASLKKYNKARDDLRNAKTFDQVNAARNVMWNMTDPDADPEETAGLVKGGAASSESSDASVPEYETGPDGKLHLVKKK